MSTSSPTGSTRNDVALDRLPGGLTAQWQIVRLKVEPAERFLTVHPITRHQSPVHIGEAGLKSLKRGLDKAGIGAETFELHPDRNGPFGWRAPYRGLEALDPEDAAVFFGRSADIVRHGHAGMVCMPRLMTEGENTMRVPNFVRRIFVKLTAEDLKPKFVVGQPVAGSRHSSIEQQQQRRTEGWLFPHGRWPGGWLR
jgi:hypothetical protein